MELDYEQYKLVKEALHERRIFLQTAPYLSAMLPIMLPIYKYWQVPYYWVGCKMYDVLAGKENMESSYLMSKGKALEAFPMLNQEGLVGAIVYYDGQHNDSRMNMALIMTAVQHGAVIANHVEVTDLHKNSEGKLTGAAVRDNLTGESWGIKAKGIINATGPFTDSLLKLDNPSHKPIVQPSSGVHITFPSYYSPRTMGLLDPQTSDGRVIFFLPWQGNTIAGTTDAKCEVEREPKAQEEDIQWVLEEVRRYLSPDIKVRRGDVLSAWSGIRPLVRNPNAASTEGLVRNHMIHVSESGLLTIAGGKWTTYRSMAEETVDEAVKVFGLENRVRSGCITERVRLVGSDGWTRNMFIGLIQRYGLSTDVAKHLSENYGDRAWTVCSLAEPTGESWPLHGIRLTPQYPFIEAEIRYACRHEYAQTAVDFIARRCRLAFLNSQTALDVLPRVVDVMAGELGWSSSRKRKELQEGAQFLESMGLAPGVEVLSAPHTWLEWAKSAVLGMKQKPDGRMYSRAQFEAGEVDSLKDIFATRAKGAGDGGTEGQLRVQKEDIRVILRETPGYENIRSKELEYVLDEAGFSKRGDFDFDEFIEICAGLKEVSLQPLRRGAKEERRSIPVARSGGGV
ncbi:DAO-domain-containing protein [Schizopora paradoxa]|uniref:glycerol-3-phosphate dehydrogenase n=1 Tax=Schizopora paradoxa TaxID=27342 RepID=A0A0H2R3A3_9AGAM|nr:DAO-domain-containing protein [Schizopora paradoxa]